MPIFLLPQLSKIYGGRSFRGLAVFGPSSIVREFKAYLKPSPKTLPFLCGTGSETVLFITFILAVRPEASVAGQHASTRHWPGEREQGPGLQHRWRHWQPAHTRRQWYLCHQGDGRWRCASWWPACSWWQTRRDQRAGCMYLKLCIKFHQLQIQLIFHFIFIFCLHLIYISCPRTFLHFYSIWITLLNLRFAWSKKKHLPGADGVRMNGYGISMPGASTSAPPQSLRCALIKSWHRIIKMQLPRFLVLQFTSVWLAHTNVEEFHCSRVKLNCFVLRIW